MQVTWAPDVLKQLKPLHHDRRARERRQGRVGAVLTLTEIVEVGEVRIYVLHDVSDLDVDPKAAELAAVVSGHSHRPTAEVRGGVLFLNPGSAGPRRFSLPVTMAKLRVVGKSLSHELIELAV